MRRHCSVLHLQGSRLAGRRCAACSKHQPGCQSSLSDCCGFTEDGSICLVVERLRRSNESRIDVWSNRGWRSANCDHLESLQSGWEGKSRSLSGTSGAMMLDTVRGTRRRKQELPLVFAGGQEAGSIRRPLAACDCPYVRSLVVDQTTAKQVVAWN